ncbi:hypothetical protein diail_11251 [Diaporthe ilicicola]|nr:hypothetical protein diail_11251 [Diaporthe ilicicola]
MSYYSIENTFARVWDYFWANVSCPWYEPVEFLRQALTLADELEYELCEKSPVFLVLFYTFLIRWVYFDYIRYLGVGRGGTPSTFGGYLRTKRLMFFCKLIGVDVFSSPFLDPMTDPYRGNLFNLEPRQGDRPTILGLTPQRQGTQKASPETEAAMMAILERKAAENPMTLVMKGSYLEGHLRALTIHLPAGSVPGRPNTIAEWGGEVSHIHKLDSSAHIVLHPADAAEVIQKGWAERHPLACCAENPFWRFWHHTICRKRLPLPHNVVLVYAPRDAAELAVFQRIVDAAVWWNTLHAQICKSD